MLGRHRREEAIATMTLSGVEFPTLLPRVHSSATLYTSRGRQKHRMKKATEEDGETRPNGKGAKESQSPCIPRTDNDERKRIEFLTILSHKSPVLHENTISAFRSFHVIAFRNGRQI